MADHDPTIDLTTDVATLEDVQRLLRSTDFATIDDLAARSGAAPLGDAIERVRVTSPAANGQAPLMDSAGLAPLPRRR